MLYGSHTSADMPSRYVTCQQSNLRAARDDIIDARPVTTLLLTYGTCHLQPAISALSALHHQLGCRQASYKSQNTPRRRKRLGQQTSQLRKTTTFSQPPAGTNERQLVCLTHAHVAFCKMICIKQDWFTM